MSNGKKSMFVTDDGQNLLFTFLLVSSLFLLWGFCNGMIDVMDKHFQDELDLSLSQSAWVQFAHYLGYFLMALPAGWLAIKLGNKGGIIAGLLMVAAGGFWFVPATWISQAAKDGDVSTNTAFAAFLFGVCVIASGLTFLETIANPYTTVLGDQKYAASRINLAQSMNSIGWIFGPIVGSMYFYSKNAAGESTGSETLYIPYVGVAVAVLVLSVIFYFAKMPDIKTEDDYHLDDNADANVSHSIWSHPHFVMAVVAQFFYVAAQAGIFSFFINYMTSQTPPVSAGWVWGMEPADPEAGFFSNWLNGWFDDKTGVLKITDKGAANLITMGFVCFFIGRYTGAALVKRFTAHGVLGVYALLNILMCGLIFLKLGWVSVFCVFLTFLFMSIMFPTIFALGIFGLGVRAKRASAYIVMAIMGGALLPKVMGWVGDEYDMSRAFIVPLLCFVVVAIYGFMWPKLSGAESMGTVDVTKGH